MDWIDYAYCVDCGTRVKRVLEKDCAVVERHSYDETGACDECGYAPECTHANTVEETEIVRWDDTYVDQKTHSTVPQSVRYVTYCADCGWKLKNGDVIWLTEEEKAQYAPEIASHDFCEGYCVDCG